MQLPQTAEYALRAVAQLAILAPGETMRATDLAKKTHVPRHYMAKVLRRLVAAGLLDVRKGPGGGYRLAHPPSRISFVRVFEAVDAAPGDGCAFGFSRCDAQKPCPLHPSWSIVKEAVRSWATTTTLADVRDQATSARPTTRKRSTP
jgi:Rrf2 family iron-sulfur cluster assembly transcriptional regulator